MSRVVNAVKSMNRPADVRRERRGSVLVLVVALMVLLALVGTVYITSARLERVTAAKYVHPKNANKDLGYEVAVKVSQMLDRAMEEGNDQRWLADRLPRQQNGNVDLPIWRAISGGIDGATAVSGNEYATMFTSPFKPEDKSAVLGPYTFTIDQRYPVEQTLVPSSLVISYPTNYPMVEKRGRTRVFPAFELADKDGRPVAGARRYLAADADGDGIADAGLWPVAGFGDLTYFAAVRVIDNAAAINAGTAWTQTAEYDTLGNATATNLGLFPGNVGLLELLDPTLDSLTNRTNAFNEMYELNEWRFGYDNDWFKAFEDTSAPPGIYASTTNENSKPLEDPVWDESLTPDQNVFRSRPDFNFINQTDALFMQMQRRWGKPGYNRDPDYTPSTNYYGVDEDPQQGDPFPYRAIDPGDSLSLAYRFVMVQPNGREMPAPFPALPTYPSTNTEVRLRRSAFDTAVNVVQGYRNSFRFYPANEGDVGFDDEYHLWFDSLNLDLNYDGAGTYTPISAKTSQFRPLRPIVTTYNPVHDRVIEHTNNVSWDETGNTGDPMSRLGNPGMLPFGKSSAPDWDDEAYYNTNDIVKQPDTDGGRDPEPEHRLTYICIKPNYGAALPTWPALRNEHWEHQPLVSDKYRASLSTGTFPHLWRAYWSVMCREDVTDGSQPVLYPDYLAEMGQVLKYVDPTSFTAPVDDEWFFPSDAAPAVPACAVWYDPYRGNHFDPATFEFGKNPDVPNPDPKDTLDPGDPRRVNLFDTAVVERNPLGMFRSTLRDPKPYATTPAYHPYRLTPFHMMMIRSALAALNTVELRRNASDPANQVVPTRTFTLYSTASKSDPNLPTKPDRITSIDPYSSPVALSSANGPTDGDGEQGATRKYPWPQYEVTIYGNKPQPFITEIYVNTDQTAQINAQTVNPLLPINGNVGKQNAEGYVAIELFNPYPFPLTLTNWRLALIDRRSTSAAYPDLPLVSLTANGNPTPALVDVVLKDKDGNAVTIPAGGFAVLHNYPEDPTQSVGGLHAQYIPGAAESVTGIPVFVHDLYKVLGDPSDALRPGGELVLLRPVDPAAVADITTPALEDYVPVDSFDFTGLHKGTANVAEAWHYVRSTANFQCVYPGRYDAKYQVGSPDSKGMASVTTGQRSTARQQGTLSTNVWDPSAGPTSDPTPYAADGYGGATPYYDPWDRFMGGTRQPIALGADDDPTNPGQKQKATYELAGTNVFSIQWANKGWAGPNPVAAANNAFPFGAFPRNGDVLQVPFIGSYRIRRLKPMTPTDFQNNVVPAGWDEDEDGAVFPYPGVVVNPAGTVLEMNSVSMDAAFAEDTDPTNNATEDIGRFSPACYAWTRNILEYVGVQTQAEGYLPEVDAGVSHDALGESVYPPANADIADLPRQATSALTARQGLININTAPWQVLAQLPLVLDPATGAPDVPKTQQLAKAIVAHREAHGPFATIWDLNDVKDPLDTTKTFQNAYGTLPTDPGNLYGDWSPMQSAPTDPADGVVGDFEERYLQVTRLSNLITARSDAFTCYLLVQAWKNIGTPYPALTWEKRYAFRAERLSDGSIVKVQIPTD